MRSVSTRAIGAVLLVLLVSLGVAPAYADEEPPADPQARLQPPGGVNASAEPSLFDLFVAWVVARLQPPVG